MTKAVRGEKWPGRARKIFGALTKIGEHETKAIRVRVASVTLKATVQPWLNVKRASREHDHNL
jgi:hypothetical protein